MFNPFLAYKSRGEGINLGLYISKIDVKEHKRQKEFEGKKAGAKITIFLSVLHTY